MSGQIWFRIVCIGTMYPVVSTGLKGYKYIYKKYLNRNLLLIHFFIENTGQMLSWQLP